MHFVPLCNESQLAEARLRFPLFYDGCLPHVPDPDAGLRHAVACDVDNTALAVLQQSHPWTRGRVCLIALAGRWWMGGGHRPPPRW
jgi:hypothetical protein